MEFIPIIFFICIGLTAAVQLKDVIAKEGDSLFLQCRGYEGNECLWTGSYPNGGGDILAMSNNTVTTDRYLLNDNPRTGDCSLNITHIQFSDEGNLTCTIKPYPPAIKYNLFVGVQPFDPRIEYKHEIVKDGDVVIIETPAEIKCIVDRGRPAAEVIWENEDLSTVNVTAVADGEFINVTSTLDIRHFPNETKPVKRITCVAHHPYYLSENNQRRISITVASTYPTQHVHIIDDNTTASCDADGIPEPNIRWQYKEEGNSTWKTISEDKVIIPERPGEYKCLARNDLNGSKWIESDNTLIANGTIQPVTEIRIAPDEITLGQSLICIALDGKPAANSFAWVLIKNDVELDILSVGSENTFTPDQEGRYQCLATNSPNIPFTESENEAIVKGAVDKDDCKKDKNKIFFMLFYKEY